jgi:hypothetical protein
MVARNRSYLRERFGEAFDLRNNSWQFIRDLLESIPNVTNGTTAPTTTPEKVGDYFVDTSAKKLYFATGTASSSDWTAVN